MPINAGEVLAFTSMTRDIELKRNKSDNSLAVRPPGKSSFLFFSSLRISYFAFISSFYHLLVASAALSSQFCLFDFFPSHFFQALSPHPYVFILLSARIQLYDKGAPLLKCLVYAVLMIFCSNALTMEKEVWQTKDL